MPDDSFQKTIAREAAARILNQLESKTVEGLDGEYHVSLSCTQLFIIISLLEKCAGEEFQSGRLFPDRLASTGLASTGQVPDGLEERVPGAE